MPVVHFQLEAGRRYSAADETELCPEHRHRGQRASGGSNVTVYEIVRAMDPKVQSVHTTDFLEVRAARIS